MNFGLHAKSAACPHAEAVDSLSLSNYFFLINRLWVLTISGVMEPDLPLQQEGENDMVVSNKSSRLNFQSLDHSSYK